MIRRALQYLMLSAAPLLLVAVPAHGATIWANDVYFYENNLVAGEFSASPYGGTFPAPFPIVLSLAAAEAAVTGAPDNTFLSLPGSSLTDFSQSEADGVWLAFGTTFTDQTLLRVFEVGASAESAWIGIGRSDLGIGALLAPTAFTRGASDELVLNLTAYAAAFAGLGGFADLVIIYGADLGGGSAGYDLDAVGIEAIPEPATLLLLGSGLAAAGLRRRAARRR
jgi:hypothetical protein